MNNGVRQSAVQKKSGEEKANNCKPCYVDSSRLQAFRCSCCNGVF